MRLGLAERMGHVACGLARGGKWKVEKEKRKMENGKLLDFATAKPILGIALKTMGLEKQPPKHQKHQNHQEQKQ